MSDELGGICCRNKLWGIESCSNNTEKVELIAHNEVRGLSLHQGLMELHLLNDFFLPLRPISLQTNK